MKPLLNPTDTDALEGFYCKVFSRMCLLICRFLMIFRYLKCATHEHDFERAQVRSAQFLRIVWNLHNCFYSLQYRFINKRSAGAGSEKQKYF